MRLIRFNTLTRWRDATWWCLVCHPSVSLVAEALAVESTCQGWSIDYLNIPTVVVKVTLWDGGIPFKIQVTKAVTFSLGVKYRLWLNCLAWIVHLTLTNSIIVGVAQIVQTLTLSFIEVCHLLWLHSQTLSFKNTSSAIPEILEILVNETLTLNLVSDASIFWRHSKTIPIDTHSK